MWTMSVNGFFSAVEHRDDPNLLMVRCRAEEDANYISQKTGAEVVRSNGLADYEFRVTVTRAQYAAFMVGEVMGVDYGNFKHEVEVRQGKARAGVYMRVWAALLSLQPIAPYANVPKTRTVGTYAWAGEGPRGGRQKNWWDDDSLVFESVTDDPEFWNCRDCGKDIVDCVCNPVTRAARVDGGRRRKKGRGKKGRHKNVHS